MLFIGLGYAGYPKPVTPDPTLHVQFRRRRRRRRRWTAGVRAGGVALIQFFAHALSDKEEKLRGWCLLCSQHVSCDIFCRNRVGKVVSIRLLQLLVDDCSSPAACRRLLDLLKPLVDACSSCLSQALLAGCSHSLEAYTQLVLQPIQHPTRPRSFRKSARQRACEGRRERTGEREGCE